MGLLVVLIAVMSACVPAPTPVPTALPTVKPTLPPVASSASTNDPIAIAKAYVDTANSGDFDKTYAFYADDSSAFVMNGALLLTNKQQIGDQWLKDGVKTTRATIKDLQVNRNTVIATGTVSLDRLKKLGIDSADYRAQYVIENGKIRFFYPTLLFTPDQAAKVQAAQGTSK